MTDKLISLQAAIDFIDAGHLVNPNEPRWSDNEVVNFLKSRPSAQPEQHWIPCSERLPEINKVVFVTDGEVCWVCSLFESQDIEDGLYQWEDNYGHWHEFETWVAWMPLPEPYQGGEQE